MLDMVILSGRCKFMWGKEILIYFVLPGGFDQKQLLQLPIRHVRAFVFITRSAKEYLTTLPARIEKRARGEIESIQGKRLIGWFKCFFFISGQGWIWKQSDFQKKMATVYDIWFSISVLHFIQGTPECSIFYSHNFFEKKKTRKEKAGRMRKGVWQDKPRSSPVRWELTVSSELISSGFGFNSTTIAYIYSRLQVVDFAPRTFILNQIVFCSVHMS